MKIDYLPDPLLQGFGQPPTKIYNISPKTNKFCIAILGVPHSPSIASTSFPLENTTSTTCLSEIQKNPSCLGFRMATSVMQGSAMIK